MTQRAVALLAEDEPLLRMLAADMLSDAGYWVIEAGCAAEALASLEYDPDVMLLVTDVQMPGRLDGFELARDVARRWPKISIIVCSGQMRPSAGDLPPGARFMDKPFERHRLIDLAIELTSGA